jgi:hypothetical protein
MIAFSLHDCVLVEFVWNGNVPADVELRGAALLALRAARLRVLIPRKEGNAMKTFTIKTNAMPNAPGGKAWDEVSASFDPFCLAAGNETLGAMMEADAEAAAGFAQRRGVGMKRIEARNESKPFLSVVHQLASQRDRYMTLETIALLGDDPTVSLPAIASRQIRPIPANAVTRTQLHHATGHDPGFLQRRATHKELTLVRVCEKWRAMAAW